MSERNSIGLRLVAFAAALTLAACGGSGDAPRLAVEPSLSLAASVPLGEPLDMGYAWQPGPEFTAPAEDYQVFVHLIDPQGAIVLQDDHYPPQPTSQWQAGEPIEYRRWVYPAEDLEVETLDVVVGLYSQDGRALVQQGGDWTDAADIHRVEIRADDMSGIPVYMDGWHPQEEGPEEVGGWRWSEGVAHSVFTNPGRDAVLHLRAHGPYDEIGAQTIVLRIGEQEVGRVEVTSADDLLERVEIPAEAMGDNDWVELTMEVSPVFVPQEADPASQDDRTLGLQVFKLYLSSS